MPWQPRLAFPDSSIDCSVKLVCMRSRMFFRSGSSSSKDPVGGVGKIGPPDHVETENMISASRENDSVALEELLQQPRNPDESNTDGKTPLFHAAEQGHVQHMELLLEAGAKTDEPEFAQGQTHLFPAARNGHLDVVQFLAGVGAGKDQADKNGRTPLWVAAQNGHLDIVRFLVEFGADKDQAATMVQRLC